METVYSNVDLWERLFVQGGPLLVFLAGAALLYIKVIMPNQLKRDSARETLITSMMENWRTDQAKRNEEYLNREREMRAAYVQQLHDQDVRTNDLFREQEERHAKEREALKQTFEAVIKAIENNSAATRQNSAFIINGLHKLGVSKTELVKTTEAITGLKVPTDVYNETRDSSVD